MHDLIIRRATLDDLLSMQTILKKATHDWTPEILRDCFSENYLNWIIAEDEKLLGFIIVKNNFHAWEIMQLAINPLFQRKGFAKKLLIHVIDRARQEPRALASDTYTIQLEVRASNYAAIALYQQCHFHEVARRKKYYADGEDAVLMDLLL